MIKKILGMLTILSLAAGCAKARELVSTPAIVGVPDQHLSFRGLTVHETKQGLRLSGWVQPSQNWGISDYQTLHVEIQKAGKTFDSKDVDWKAEHGGRPRRHLTSLLSIMLPPEARSADLISVSHKHPSDADLVGSGGGK